MGSVNYASPCRTYLPISDDFCSEGRYNERETETNHYRHHCCCDALVIIKQFVFRPRPHICTDLCRRISHPQESAGCKIGGNRESVDSCVVVENCCLERAALYTVHQGSDTRVKPVEKNQQKARTKLNSISVCHASNN